MDVDALMMQLADGLLRRIVARRRPELRGPVRTRTRARKLIGLVYIAPALFLTSCLFLAPLCMGIWMSLSKWQVLGGHSFVGLANYRQLVRDPDFGQSLAFGGLFTIVVVPLVLIAGLMLAILLHRPRRSVAIVRAAVIAPVTIGFATASYLWLSLLDPNTGILDRFLVDLHIAGQPVNWLDSRTSAMAMVILVTTWKQAGFAMIVLMNGLQAVPQEVEEAAKIDGAGSFRVLWSVKLPLMRRSMVLATVFVGLACFLSFDQFYVLTGGGPNNSTITPVFRIYDTAFIQGDFGYASAMSVGVMAIVLLVTSLQLRLIPRDY